MRQQNAKRDADDECSPARFEQVGEDSGGEDHPDGKRDEKEQAGDEDKDERRSAAAGQRHG